MKRALVLGGGGVAGIGWETGVLSGLAEAGVDVTGADLLVGTSAGSVVAAQVAAGVPLRELFDRCADGRAAAGEIPVDFDPEKMMAELVPLLSGVEPGASLRAAVGRWAQSVPTVDPARRHEAVAARLPSRAWPARPIRIVAVDADSGEERVFTEHDDVDLVDAVAASCAVPGVWPVVAIDGRRYVDGGIRTSANIDLAAGCDVVVVLAPVVSLAPVESELQARCDRLEREARVVTIRPDEASLAAIGTNPLDPATQAAAAVAGLAQGRAEAGAVRAAWQGG